MQKTRKVWRAANSPDVLLERLRVLHDQLRDTQANSTKSKRLRAKIRALAKAYGTLVDRKQGIERLDRESSKPRMAKVAIQPAAKRRKLKAS